MVAWYLPWLLCSKEFQNPKHASVTHGLLTDVLPERRCPRSLLTPPSIPSLPENLNTEMRRGAKQQLIAVLGFCAAAYAMHVESQLRRSEIDPSFSYEPGCNVGGFSCTGVRTVLCWLMLASANSSAL